jgi:staphylococcal nuclease domain-containing protein 1
MLAQSTHSEYAGSARLIELMAQNVGGVETGWLSGTVKAVHGPDKLVIVGSAGAGQRPPEKIAGLAEVRVPQLTRGKEDPFAFDAREHLRHIAIGRRVTFRVTSHSERGGGRELASVHRASDGQSLAYALALAGYACASDDAHPAIAKAESAAQHASVGMWGSSSNAFKLPVDEETSPATVLSGSHCDSVSVIIEGFLSASVVRVRLMRSLKTMNIPLAGAQSPRAPSSQSEGDPFGEEARSYAELFALHRDAVLELYSNQNKWDSSGNNALGRLWVLRLDSEQATERGGSYVDLAQSLIYNGLAEYVASTAALLPQVSTQLQQAESYAQQRKLGLWIHKSSPKSVVNNSFEATVLEVHAGDSITVVDDSSQQSRRYQLASIRAPKPGNPRRGVQPEQYANEALEFARKKLIGQRIIVTPEYTRTLPGDQRTIEHARVRPSASETESADENDFGYELLAAGLGTVIRHKKGDDRSSNYEMLLQAEAEAKQKRLQLHSGKEPPPNRVNDLTQAKKQRALEFLPFLQRAGKVRGVVQVVISGHKLKVSVPSQNCQFNLVLAAVRCSSVDEAVQFTKRYFNQRDVQVEVENSDRAGNFLGSLTLANEHMDLASELLKRGSAYIPPTLPLEKIHNGMQLREFEKEAREAVRGLWAHNELRPDASDATKEAKEDGVCSEETSVDVCVTSVADAGQFFAVRKTNFDKLQHMQDQLQTVASTDAGVDRLSESHWHAGSMCMARFESGDKNWYRATVLNRENDGQLRIHFIDYGNAETLKAQSVRVLPHSMASTPPLAQQCMLSHVHVPREDEDCYEDAMAELQSLIAGAEMRAFINSTQQPSKGKKYAVHCMTLYPPGDNSQSVNYYLAANGLGICTSDAPEELIDAQESALRLKLGVFRYGDPRGEKEL